MPFPCRNMLMVTLLAITSGTAFAQNVMIGPGGRIIHRPGSKTPTTLPEDAGINEGGVTVMDSLSAQDAIVRADMFVAAQDWAGASAAYQKTMDQFGPYLLVVSKMQRRTVADVLQDRILKWPAEGLAAYQRYAEPLAAQALASAERRGSLPELLTVANRYFATPSGAAAADLAADRLADAGDPAAGAAVLDRLRIHPQVKRPSILARLALWRGWTGQSAEAEKLRQELQALVPPKDALLAKVTQALLQPLAVQKSNEDYPIFGGDQTRTRPLTTATNADVVTWQRSYRVFGEPNRDEEQQGIAQAIKDGMFLNSLPVAAEGMIFLQDQASLMAFNVNSGSQVWKVKLANEEMGGNAGNRRLQISRVYLRPELCIPTVADGRIYAVVGLEYTVMMRNVVISGRNRPIGGTITCRAARTGEEIWTMPSPRQDIPAPEALQGLKFDGSPLVLNGRVYVIGHRYNPGGMNEDVHLVCVEAETGRFNWSVFLSSAPLIRSDSIPSCYLVADAGRILAVTHAGSIAAVDAVSGRIAWLNLYPRDEIFRQYYSEGRERVFCWQNNPPFVDRGRLITLPMDGKHLFILNTSDGKELARIEQEKLGEVRELVGVQDSRLYGVSKDEVFAFDLDRGEVTWKVALPAPVFGRACLTTRGLFVPTFKQLVFYPRDATEPIKLPPVRPPEQMGNVVALPTQILVTGWSELTSYARWEDVRERLAAAVKANPGKPGPCLDMAEVALRSGGENQTFGFEMLDQAAEWAGGWNKMQPAEFGKRMFRTCLSLAADAKETKRSSVAEKLLERAYRCPPDVPARIEMLLTFSKFYESQNQPAEAVAKLQEILTDPALRREMTPRQQEKDKDGKELKDVGESQAGRIARLKIEKLTQMHGDRAYSRFEAQVRQKLKIALTKPEKERMALLDEIATVYPNSTVVPETLLARANSAIAAGAHEQAYYTLLELWNSHREKVDLSLVIRLLAEEAAAGGRPSLAADWLTKGQGMFRNTPLDLGNGKSTTFAELSNRLLGADVGLSGISWPNLPSKLPNKYVIKVKSPAVLEPAYTSAESRNDLLVFGCVSSITKLKNAPVLPVLCVFQASTGQEWIPPIRLIEPATRLIAVWKDRLLLQTKRRILAVSLGGPGLSTRPSSAPATGGQILWSFDGEGETPDTDPENIVQFQNVILAGGQIIAIRGAKAADEGEIFALQASQGQLLWRYRLKNLPDGEVAFSGDKYLAYRINSPTGGVLVVVNLERGEEIHRLAAGRQGQAVFYGFSPEGKLIVLSEQRINAFEPESGELLWWTNEAEGNVNGPPKDVTFGQDGFYVQDMPGRLVKFGYENGQKLWAMNVPQSPQVSNSGASMMPASLFLEDGKLYVAGFRQVDAVNSQTGKVWAGRVPASANFIVRKDSADFILALNERAPGRQTGQAKPETTKSYDLYFYNKQAQMRCDAVLDMGSYTQFGMLLVRDQAAGIVSPNQITMYTAEEPKDKEIKLGAD